MKYRYYVSADNQLLIKTSVTKKPLLAGGRFGIDKNNRLFYCLNEPVSWRRQHGLPPKIVFKGSWQLNENYDLELVLDKTAKQFQGDILVIKGNIISTDRDILAFEIKTFDQNGLLHIQLFKLSVTWFSDEANRLSFLVKKQPPDTLTLGGNWQINRSRQITYTYEKTDLKRKTKISNTLVFEGFWQISSANKLTYILKNSTSSRFDFRVQIESPNLYPQKGVIKYRLGIGARDEGRLRDKIVTLYGAWKFSRKAGLSFEMDYGRGKVRAMKFETNVYLTKRDEVTLALLSKEKEPLGLNITFTRRFLRRLDAEAFLRLKKSMREAGIEAGLRVPF